MYGLGDAFAEANNEIGMYKKIIETIGPLNVVNMLSNQLIESNDVNNKKEIANMISFLSEDF